MREHYSRREVLATTAIAGVTALAGCTGGGGDSGGGGDTTTTEEQTTESGSGTTWEKTSTVKMTDELKYEPKNIQVSAGTTVTWKNVGSVAHSVTAYEDKIPDGAAYFASGGFDSEQAAKDNYPDKGSVAKGETYEHTFETKGTYEYYCIPHEMSGMVGKVKVV